MTTTTTQWAFDIEIFANFFSVVFLDLSTEEDLESISKNYGISHPDVKHFIYAPSLGHDDLDSLEEFLSEDIELVGFNNLMFDSPVMDFVVSDRASVREIYKYAQSIISTERGARRIWRERTTEWKEIDLMKMMAFDSLGVSLKQASINLQWSRVQDLPFPYDHTVATGEVDTVLDYNLNDVLISALLYRNLHKELNLRRDLSTSYGIDLMSASDSRMANLMLEDIYTKESGIPLDQIRHLRTERNLVWLRNCIGKNISFKTEKLRALKTEIDNTVVVAENNFAFKERISFGNCEYEIGVGGLHTVDEPCAFYTDDRYIIQDADVASFYPNIIIKNDIKPSHLDANFVTILDKITRERVEAKKNDKTKADGLKITINSIFGKLNSEYFWLQDAKAMLSVTLSGQLYLLMLIEELMLNGIMTISANTDGIVCRIPRELEDVYYNVCEWWEEKTDFSLEYTPYDAYIRTDVNNYITIKSDGKTKEKGRYLKEISLKKGYRYPIVPRALYAYLVHDVPVMDTLLSCDNVLDFCISQKSGGKFSMEFHNGEDITHLQKNNRFYITDESGGKLIKRNGQTGKTMGLYVSENVAILNDFDVVLHIDEYNIKYEFYENEAMKYIYDIESGLFDLNFVDEELSTHPQEELIEISDNVEIVPAKFRHSSGAYRYDPDEGKVYRGIASINYLTADTGELLYSIKDVPYENFLDFLLHNSNELKLNSRQIDILIKIGFFSEFGGRYKLLEFYEEFTKGKFRYSPSHKDKTKENRIQELSKIWDDMPNKDFSIREIIDTEIRLLKRAQSRFRVHKKIGLIEDIDTTFSPRLYLYSLSRGTRLTVKVQKKLYKKLGGIPGNILQNIFVEKRPKMKKVGEHFEEIDGYDWWMTSYEIMENL